jgi:hypothetical protein
VLLIVDDLDRCEPAHMSTVIESLKLLVEDHTLQGRVQVVALVEEETLRWAIECRFKGRVADLPETERAQELERLIAEHLQKLFIGHMRLPPLGHDELEEVLDKYLGGHDDAREPVQVETDHTTVIENPAPEQPVPLHASGDTAHEPNRPAAPWSRPDTDVIKTAIVKPPKADKPELEVSPVPTRPAPGVNPGGGVTSLAELERTGASFSDDERADLKAALPDIIEHERARSGPRSLRSFLLQYQLARLLLLAHAHTRVPPRVLIDALLHGRSDDTLDSDEQKTLRAVIAMVQPWLTAPAPAATPDTI